jgi:3-oxoacyl-[acyl-carrier protein] reductase
LSRVVWVTGAGGGLGRALVRALRASGDTVIATDLVAPGFDEPGVECLAQDVTSWERWCELRGWIVSRHERLDVLMNVAGYLRPGRTGSLAVADIDRHLDVNVRGVAYGLQVAAEHMVGAGAGHVVNVASLAGIAPIPGLTLYSASKFAVRGLSLAAAMELAERGVAVTVVCPDAIGTPMLDLQVEHPEAALTFSGTRVLSADEVASIVVGRVLRERPLECVIPAWRGAIARVAGALPGVAKHSVEPLRRIGSRNQGRYRKA